MDRGLVLDEIYKPITEPLKQLVNASTQPQLQQLQQPPSFMLPPPPLSPSETRIIGNDEQYSTPNTYNNLSDESLYTFHTPSIPMMYNEFDETEIPIPSTSTFLYDNAFQSITPPPHPPPHPPSPPPPPLAASIKPIRKKTEKQRSKSMYERNVREKIPPKDEKKKKKKMKQLYDELAILENATKEVAPSVLAKKLSSTLPVSTPTTTDSQKRKRKFPKYYEEEEEEGVTLRRQGYWGPSERKRARESVIAEQKKDTKKSPSISISLLLYNNESQSKTTPLAASIKPIRKKTKKQQCTMCENATEEVTPTTDSRRKKRKFPKSYEKEEEEGVTLRRRGYLRPSERKRARESVKHDDLVSGEGLERKMVASDVPVEYVYWNDPNELVDRLQLLVASKNAGNTSHDNELESILEELREDGLIL